MLARLYLVTNEGQRPGRAALEQAAVEYPDHPQVYLTLGNVAGAVNEPKPLESYVIGGQGQGIKFTEMGARTHTRSVDTNHNIAERKLNPSAVLNLSHVLSPSFAQLQILPQPYL